MIFTRIHLDHPLLREALCEAPETEVEWERMDVTDPSEMLFWARGDDLDTFEAALEEDPTVTVSRSFDVGDRRLYKVHLGGGGPNVDLYPILVETASLLRRATATHDGWCYEFYFADRSALGRFVEACREYDIEFEVVRLGEVRDADRPEFGLTDTQREALRTALEVGYFEVPRENNLTELAGRLGISDTAVSQRLRRGLSTLLERTLAEDDCAST